MPRLLSFTNRGRVLNVALQFPCLMDLRSLERSALIVQTALQAMMRLPNQRQPGQFADSSCAERNKALAIQQTTAHCLVTAERPLASIGGVNASCAPAQPCSGASKCRLDDPQNHHRHSNTAWRKRHSTFVSRPKGCPLVSAARSFCEKPTRSILPERSTIG